MSESPESEERLSQRQEELLRVALSTMGTVEYSQEAFEALAELVREATKEVNKRKQRVFVILEHLERLQEKRLHPDLQEALDNWIKPLKCWKVIREWASGREMDLEICQAVFSEHIYERTRNLPKFEERWEVLTFFAEAVEFLTSATEQGPDNALKWYLLGRAHLFSIGNMDVQGRPMDYRVRNYHLRKTSEAFLRAFELDSDDLYIRMADHGFYFPVKWSNGEGRHYVGLVGRRHPSPRGKPPKPSYELTSRIGIGFKDYTQISLQPVPMTKYLPALEELRIVCRTLEGIDLSPLAGHDAFRRLVLYCQHFKGIDLTPLASCPNFSSLVLMSTRLPEIDLGPLASCRHLRRIDLGDNRLQTLDLSPFTGHPSLEFLDIFGHALIRLDLSPLFLCPEFKTLQMCEASHVDEEEYDRVHRERSEVMAKTVFTADARLKEVEHVPKGLVKWLDKIVWTKETA